MVFLSGLLGLLGIIGLTGALEGCKKSQSPSLGNPGLLSPEQTSAGSKGPSATTPTIPGDPEGRGDPASPPNASGPSSTNPSAHASTNPNQGTSKPDASAKVTAVDKHAEAVVIGYHRVVAKVKHPDTEITPEDFERQMQTLKDNGVQVIGMQDYLAWRRGEKNIPSHCAILTIDDGYKCIYDTIWPILKKFGYPATLFIYTDYVKGGPKSGGESLSWEQLAELRDAGFDIQSHTVSHHDLRGKRHGPQDAGYEAWLWNELNGSKTQLEAQLGIKVNSIAVPYGFCNQHVRDIAAKAGYEAVFTVYGQKLTYSSPLDALGRYIIESNKPQLFATAIDFGGRSSQGGGPDPVAELNTAAIETQPADGQTTSELKPPIKANLQNFPSIDAGSLQMRISGLGVVPAIYSPASKSLHFRPSKDLSKGQYTVIVSAKSQGRKTEARWSFKIE